MNLRVGNEWDLLLYDLYNSSFYKNLERFLTVEYQNNPIYPSKENIFSAYKITKYQNIKAVIIGQDPYHQPEQAHGLVFSVREGIKIPPSLRNIFKELKEDLNIEIPPCGNLEHWAEEGVLLLNTILTVQRGLPLSHSKKGWEQFTEYVIKLINQKESSVVFILWGKPAQSYQKFITAPQHFILIGAHPSPLSAYSGFFGGKYFSRCNTYLKERGIAPINWELL